jgi:hypothetical protein
MRIESLIAAIVLTTAITSPVMAARSPQISRIAASSNADCTAQRKVCYASKTQTDGNGVRYVPPEAVRDCEAAFRMCVAHH